MRTLGFSVGHDKGAVIIENGKVVIGITQERLSRIKHDGAFSEGQIPLSSINYCLNELGICERKCPLPPLGTSHSWCDQKTYNRCPFPACILINVAY